MDDKTTVAVKDPDIRDDDDDTTTVLATSTIQLQDLYMKTPLIKSEPLTKLLRSCTNSNEQRDVYLKLDNLQRSGSYKDRGMAYLLYHKKFGSLSNNNSDNNNNNNNNNATTTTTTTNTPPTIQKNITNIVCSSGGNAGLAAATVAYDLQLQCTVVVPNTTKSIVIDKLRSLHANVIITGQNWNEADTVAQQMIQNDIHQQTLYVPPYDHHMLWTGISTIIDEIYESLSNKNPSPSTIILSVGGGGLLCGILEGLQNIFMSYNTNTIPMPHIICSETEGAASYHESYINNTVVTLNEITSIATSLGALSITPIALQRTKQYPGIISSTTCTDMEAVQACLNFARDHRMLVEPACGAALAVLYSDRLRNQYFSSSTSSSSSSDNDNICGPVIIEICGGSGIDIDLLKEWEQKLL